MSFQLDQVVPWGRSFDEYRRMFALTSDDLDRRILGCADGPAAFHATLHERGGAVTSCDPLYRFSRRRDRTAHRGLLPHRAPASRGECLGVLLGAADQRCCVLGASAPGSDGSFSTRLSAGRAEGRYVAEELPRLSFADRSFHLALCSHFLFLYASLGESFHEQSLRELLRVAGEVRVFPLLGLDGQPPPFLDSIVARFRQEGFSDSSEPDHPSEHRL
ncbi:MAG: hypothetical protein R3B96_12235 [Pirellulaceae bacterium]